MDESKSNEMKLITSIEKSFHLCVDVSASSSSSSQVKCGCRTIDDDALNTQPLSDQISLRKFIQSSFQHFSIEIRLIERSHDIAIGRTRDDYVLVCDKFLVCDSIRKTRRSTWIDVEHTMKRRRNEKEEEDDDDDDG